MAGSESGAHRLDFLRRPASGTHHRFESLPGRVLARHPYWVCVSRAALTAMLRTFFVVALAERALIGVLFAEWFMSHRTSSNVGLRAVTQLQHFDRYWATGACLGAAAGIAVSHLIYHPYDAIWYDPRTWSNWQTVTGVRDLAVGACAVACAWIAGKRD